MDIFFTTPNFGLNNICWFKSFECVTKSGLDVLFTQAMNFNKIVGVTEKVAPTIAQIQYAHALENLNNANLGAIFIDGFEQAVE
jgi:hypothetical protein